MQHKEIIDKIRKLLRLSRSANVHEAAAAAAKAQELLAKYNLAQESITDDETPEAQCIFKKTRKQLEKWAYVLAHRCADAFDCGYYHDVDTGKTVFVGVGADPEVCGWMYEYLYKTLLRLASAHLRSDSCIRLRSNKSRQLARVSFLFGAVSVIIRRLEEQKKRMPSSCGTLVISKKRIIEAALPSSVRISKMNPVKIREQNWYDGAQAASNVPLSMPLKDARPVCLALA